MAVVSAGFYGFFSGCYGACVVLVIPFCTLWALQTLTGPRLLLGVTGSVLQFKEAVVYCIRWGQFFMHVVNHVLHKLQRPSHGAVLLAIFIFSLWRATQQTSPFVCHL